jgi:xylulokinase
MQMLPDDVAPVASARGAALLAGVASGIYPTAQETLKLAPEPDRTIEPGKEKTSYEAAYERYAQLYPRLRG